MTRFSSSPLWTGLSDIERAELTECLGGHVKKYARDAMVIQAGQQVVQFGVIQSGQASIVTENIEGVRNVIALLSSGDLFAEVFALSARPCSVSVYAQTELEVLYISAVRAMSICASGCTHHKQFVWNILRVIASKNVLLNEKIQCLGQRSIREKVSMYLSLRHAAQKKNPFEIELNRQEMADFLCVDRSALSAVLSELKKDGLIDYKKNRFLLLKMDHWASINEIN